MPGSVQGRRLAGLWLSLRELLRCQLLPPLHVPRAQHSPRLVSPGGPMQFDLFLFFFFLGSIYQARAVL